MKNKYSEMSVRSAVFELFNKAGNGITHISLKDMRSASGKDERELKEVLTEICEFERKGEMRGRWTLKAEYREKL